jgi:phosphatidylglycerol---prolipoprotein diacylglyceryl transferase
MFYWDPNPDFIIIPLLNWPIKWYGLLFALGFAVGFPIFEGIVYRYFLQRPDFYPCDILGRVDLRSLKLDRIEACEGIQSQKVDEFEKEAISCRALNPDKAVARLCWEEKWGDAVWKLKKKAMKVTDQITLYTVIATVIGARLGHFLFYEKPSEYLNDPMEILRTWNGGLASHGAALAIIAAIWILSCWSKTVDPGLRWIRLLDFISVPTALAGAFIRFGNFINQEILGTPTSVPWAVVFGHPADGSMPLPRHPVQLYEAFFYLAVFFLLWRLTFRPANLLKEGRLIGLFLILVFGFRFFVEFLKLEQSRLLTSGAELTMGQWLSVPLVILGALLLFYPSPKER